MDAFLLIGQSNMAGRGEIDAKATYLWKTIDRKYYEDGDREEAFRYAKEAAYYALVDSLGDPYSQYLTKEDLEDLEESLEGAYFGIGVTIYYDNESGYVTVAADPFEGSPAADAGIRKNDKLLSVDEITVTRDTMEEAVRYLRTPRDGSIRILWLRGNEQMSADVTPSDVVIKSIQTGRYEDIAYIRITSFDQNTGTEFAEAMEGIPTDSTRGLILDLRDNPGGVMDAAVEVCDQLLPAGIVVYTKDKAGKRMNYKSSAPHYDIPMVLLTNGGSASASEITAGALKSYRRATLVGTTTFGKGVVQGIYPLPDGSAVKLTVSRYYTPDDICIHGTGIEPDVTVELPPDAARINPLDFDLASDTQMKKAIEILKGEAKAP